MYLHSLVLLSLIVTIIGVCANESGKACKSPFLYKSKLYYSCTKAGGYDRPWCYDIRGNDNWDYCTSCQESMLITIFIVAKESIYITVNFENNTFVIELIVMIIFRCTTTIFRWFVSIWIR